MSAHNLPNNDFLSDEEIDFDWDEELEEEIKPTKKKKNVLSNLQKLETHFDIVEVQALDTHEVLTCKNIVNDKPGIDYEIWLNIKVQKSSGAERGAEEVLKYINKLFKSPNSTPTQIGLFDEPDSLYDKKNIDNLTFWECFNNYCLYYDDNFLHTLPQSNEEMIEVVKNCLTLVLENPEKEYEHFSFDDDYNYFATNEPISDREVVSRLYSTFRAKFGSYIQVEDTYSIDDSKNVFAYVDIGEIRHHYYASYYDNEYKLEYQSGKKYYDLYQVDFIEWIREQFNIPRKEPLTDKEVLKEQLKRLAYSLISNSKKFDLIDFINKSKDAKDFKSKFSKFIKEECSSSGSMGGYGSPLDDCYSASGGTDINHTYLTVDQKSDYRKSLGRDTVGVNTDYMSEGRTTIYSVKGTDVFLDIYKYLSNKPTYIQTTLF